MIEGWKFYILSDKTDHAGNRMVIQADPKDQYAPRTTGVHNVYLAPWSGKENPNVL